MSISISHYMPSGSPHAVCVDLGVVKLYFSYDLFVAYWVRGKGTTVCVDYDRMATSTRKHIRYIEKFDRPFCPVQHNVDDGFMKRLEQCLKGMG